MTLDVPFELALIKSEILHAIEHESALRPDDYFNRRSGRLYFNIQSVIDNLDFMVSVFKDYFQWSEEQFKSEMARAKVLIADVSKIVD